HLNVVFDKALSRILITNASSNDVALLGGKLSDHPPSINPAPIWIAPAAGWEIPVPGLVGLFAADKPGSPDRLVNYEIYCRNQDGVPFVVKVVFIGNVSQTKDVTVRTRTISIVQRDWNQ